MLTLILKSLNTCNFRCAYCSLGDKTQGTAFSPEQMTAALHFFAAYACEQGETTVNIIFHGGEPMLLPAKQYGDCIQALLRDFPQLEFRFSMQTNGSILSPDYLEIFSRYDIHMGVSLDGEQAIHDSQRRDTAGQATYAGILENIRTLQQHNISVSALMVLTRQGLTADLKYLKELDVLHLPLKINPLLAIGDAAGCSDLLLSPGDYGDYLIRVFRYLVEESLELSILPLESMLYSILEQTRPSGCTFDPFCCRRFLCIDQQGRIYPCGRFADAHVHQLGTIETGITVEGRQILQMMEKRRTSCLPEQCVSCEIVDSCCGGCHADVDWNAGMYAPDQLCEDYRRIFRFLRGEGLRLLRGQLLTERGRLLCRLAELEDAQ